MTQEALAARLNMSSQAVSKWENNVTLPDIQVLPELSVLLGVTIDELFALTDDTHLERIANMISNELFISADDFSYAENFLKGKLSDGNEASKAQCLTLLARLHIHRSEEHRKLASHYAKEALILDPTCKNSHNALRDAENGVIFDWNYSNHHKLIEYYTSFVEQHPGYWRAYVWLLNYLLADGRCTEARGILESLKFIRPGYLYPLYSGLICKEEGAMTEALVLWEQMTDQYPDDWMAWSARGDCMAKVSRYDEAIEYYARGHELQSSPRYTDSLEAMSHIYRIQGKYRDSIRKMREIIALLELDWSTTEGKTVDYYYGEIERLQKLMDEPA